MQVRITGHYGLKTSYLVGQGIYRHYGSANEPQFNRGS
jgi:hypothetical protein